MFLLGLCAVLLFLGMWRYDLSVQQKNVAGNISRFNDQNEIIFEGVVVSEPDIRQDQIKYTVQAKEIFLDPKQKNIIGKVLVTLPRYPEYEFGQKLKIEGKILTPKIYKDFSYKDYLSKFGIYSVSYNPKVQVVSYSEGNILLQKILIFKKRFKNKLNSLFHEPHSSLLNGIILGEKRGMPEELREKFNIVGVSHIIVISGFHVSIIAGLLMNLLLVLRFSKINALIFSIFGILLFVVITGFQTSAIRAAIMGALVLLAVFSGRLNNPRNVIILAAVIMLLINPKLLRYDVGFQLSFLATLGIIYLSANIKKYLLFLPEIFKIRESAAMTLSAQFLTLPIIIYNFERISLIAPLANILIVPLVPISMCLGSLAGFAGFISDYLSQGIAYMAWLILTYKIMTVEFLASLKFSSYEIYNLSWTWVAAYYVVSFYIIYQIKKAEILKEKIG